MTHYYTLISNFEVVFGVIFAAGEAVGWVLGEPIVACSSEAAAFRRVARWSGNTRTPASRISAVDAT
jgi:hypothetical protein